MSVMHKKMHRILSQYDWYNQFITGKIDRKNYLQCLLENKSGLLKEGLNEDQIHLSTRFPLSNEQIVDFILDDLQQRDMISSVDYPKQAFAALQAQVAAEFVHDIYSTCIFPEEARLLYALTHIRKPKVMMFLGSYYGYWAVWSAAILKETGGTIYLVDTDTRALALTEINMKKFNFDSAVRYINEDAIQYMAREKISHDFLVINSEGPKQGPDPDLLQKAIYYPMIKTAHPYLAKSGLVLCHNILLNHPIEDAYFEMKISQNQTQFGKFLPFMLENYQAGVWYDTTAGVGVFNAF